MRQRVDRMLDERYLTTRETLLLLRRILETQYRTTVVPIGFERHVLAVEECPIGIGDRQMALGIDSQLLVMNLNGSSVCRAPRESFFCNDQFRSRSVHRVRACQRSREEARHTCCVLTSCKCILVFVPS